MIYFLALCYLIVSGLLSKSLLASLRLESGRKPHPFDLFCVGIGIFILLGIDVYFVGLGLEVLLQ